MQRQAHIEKYRSRSPVREGPSEGGTEKDNRLPVEAVAEGARARSSRSSGGAGDDGNPWIGTKSDGGDGMQHLVIGGEAVQRVPRSSGVTSAR